MSCRFVSFGRAGLAVFVIATLSCGGSGTEPIPPVVPVLTTVTVTLSSPTIQVAQTASATVTGLDQNGASIAVGAVTWSTGSASVASITTAGVVTGVAPGQTVVIASAGGKQGQQSITVLAPLPVASVTVAPSAPSLVVGGTQQLTATTLDANGATLTGRTITWTTSDATKATVSSTGLVTAAAVGTATITATSEGKLGTAAVTVTAGAATKLVVTTAPSASAPNQVAFATQPVVQLQDANGNAVQLAGTVVSAAITAGGGTLGGAASATTASGGAATFSNLSIGGTVGPQTLTFAVPGLTSATAIVTLTPGAAANIAVNAGNNQSATAGGAVSTKPSVKVTDANGNAVSGVSVTFAVASGGGSITGATASTGSDGIATVGSFTLGTTAGTNTLTATASGLTGSPLTFTATGIPGAAAALALAAGSSETADERVLLSVQPEVQLQDKYGNNVSLAGALVHVQLVTAPEGLRGLMDVASTGTGRAIFTNLVVFATGTQTLRFSSSGLTSVTASVTVRPYVGTSTVVIRVVGTDPTFGQENLGVPAWPRAAPVKESAGYTLFDLEIGRDAAFTPTYVRLYRFKNFTWLKFVEQIEHGLPSAWPAYRDSSLISSIAVAPGSAQVLAALEQLMGEAISEERATRLLLTYSGHGGPQSFFENATTMGDGAALVAFVRQKIGSIPLIFDASTQCQVGFWDFAKFFQNSTDYLLASEQPVGGFPITAPIDEWLKYEYNTNLHQFWDPANSISQALDAIIKARQSVWLVNADGIISSGNPQSIAVYKMGNFVSFMDTLAHRPSFRPASAPSNPTYDIGTYVYSQNDPALTSAFEAFRISYASSRNIAPWTYQTYGFSVLDRVGLEAYLLTLP